MEKVVIRHIAATAIIHKASDPSQLFIEMKDGGYPWKAIRNTGCTQGGNWVGEHARADTGPLQTLQRELREELSFNRPVRDSEELQALFDTGEAGGSPPPVENVTTADARSLLRFTEAMLDRVLPYGTFLTTVNRALLDAADAENGQDTFTMLVAYFSVGLADQEWQELVGLQEKFGNLSNESLSRLTSLHEIVEKEIPIAFGHDRVLQSFLLARGFGKARDMVLMPHVECVFAGPPADSYDEYLHRFDVQRTP